MTDIGPNFKLPSSATTGFYFLKSTSDAANGYFGRLGLNTSYANADLTNYVLDVTGGKTRLNSTTAASSTNTSSQLIVSNSNSGNVAIELWRNANASWQIANETGTLYFRNN